MLHPLFLTHKCTCCNLLPPPHQPSGPMKGIKEVLFTKGSIAAQSIKVVIRGRPNPSYSTSIYWMEVCGR